MMASIQGRGSGDPTILLQCKMDVSPQLAVFDSAGAVGYRPALPT